MKHLTDKKKQNLSDLSLLFVAAVWGGGFVAVKDALEMMSPLFLMSYRFILASLIMYIFMHKKIGKFSKNDLKIGAIVGFILYLAFASQTFGLQFTTASKQGFLTATYVVMVPLIYWILYKKRPSGKAFMGSFLAIVGIGFVSIQKDMVFNVGDGLTLLCALLFASHIISLEYYTKKMDALKLSFLQLAFASLFFIVSALIFEPIPVEVPERAWYAIVYLAIFSTFLCFTAQTIAQKYTTSSHASIIMSLESVFAAVFGVIILNELLTPMMLVGCVLIFVAILLIEVEFKKKKVKKEKLNISNKA